MAEVCDTMDKVISAKQHLKSQLEKPRECSLKWRMTVIGLKGVGGMFIAGMIGFVFLPALAVHIATLVQFSMTAWGGIVGIYLGAKGAVDFKTTSALEQVAKDENKSEDVHQTIEHVYAEGAAGSPAVKPFAQHASDEHS